MAGDYMFFHEIYIKSTYINSIVSFILIIMLILIVKYFTKKYFNKRSLKKINKIINISFITLVLILLISIILIFVFANPEEGSKTKYNKICSYGKNFTYNKVLIVGDSRMEYIEEDNTFTIPSNFEFVAKSAMRIDWLRYTAYEQVENILKDTKYQYHVVFNMGVNDISDDISIEKRAKEYFEIYTSLAKEFPNAKMYLLSVNPVNDKIISKYHDGKRSNKRIEEFNSYTLEYLKKAEKNMYYCDSYNEMKFEAYDGLHYSHKTNEDVINYINDKCVKYQNKIDNK